ncbi:hypothetical protein HMPREF3039_02624 [Akkermansia sp. KLE1798]|nr:hypothetical protein HMPREF3039_02624 [Akkermansia sp. KLE1798]
MPPSSGKAKTADPHSCHPDRPIRGSGKAASFSLASPRRRH